LPQVSVTASQGEDFAGGDGIALKTRQTLALLTFCCSSSRGSYARNPRLSRGFAARPARRAAFVLAAGVPGSPTSAVLALVGVVEPAVSIASPHPSRVAAAGFHEVLCRRGRGSVSLRAPNRGLTPTAKANIAAARLYCWGPRLRSSLRLALQEITSAHDRA